VLRYLTPRNINIYAFKDLGQCELEGAKIGKKKTFLKIHFGNCFLHYVIL